MRRRTLVGLVPAVLALPRLAAALPHIRSGRVRPVAVTGTSRHPALNSAPTFAASGLEGFDAQQWYGVVGPAGLPAPIVARLNETLNTVLKGADLRDKLSAEAVEPMPMTQDQFALYMREDLARWSRLALERKIQVDN